LAFFEEMTGRLWMVYLGVAMGASGAAILLAYAATVCWETVCWFAARFGKDLVKLVLWLGCLAAAYSHLSFAISYPCDARLTVDFANQWLMGRMFLEDQGHNLYLAGPQKEVLRSGYVVPSEHEAMFRDIVLKGMHNTGEGNRPLREVEGPLYPPVMALFMAVYAWQDPQIAAPDIILVYVMLTFVSGWLIQWGTRGRLWASAATLLILGFPNYYHGLCLGQNSYFTIFLVVAGWALWARNHPWLGGFVWSMLAYKAVFAVALLWVPLVLLRGRVLLGMMLGGALWCVATLPFCLAPHERHLFVCDPETGSWRWDFDRDRIDRMLQPWFRWLEVGKNASFAYDCDWNWVWMSRDLYSLPRRACWETDTFAAHFRYALYIQKAEMRPHPRYGECAMLHLDGDRWVAVQEVHARPAPHLPESPPDLGSYFGWKLNPTLLSRLLLGGVVAVTVLMFALLWVMRWARGLGLTISPQGPGTAFALMGGLLSCFHFMHYDLLPMALPVALLWASLGSARRFGWRVAAWCVQVLLTVGMIACALDLSVGTNSITRLPFETFGAILIWIWCGVRMLVEETRQSPQDA